VKKVEKWESAEEEMPEEARAVAVKISYRGGRSLLSESQRLRLRILLI
jgi:hypothetical protein